MDADELDTFDNEQDANETYAEDFEDYDDDGFENDEEEATEAKIPLLKRAASPPPRLPPPTYAQVASGKRIVESLLKAKSQTLNPAQTIAAVARGKRWVILKPKLTEVVMAPILDMPPQTLAELSASGQGGTARLSVKGVQAPLEEEIRSVDVQTDDVGTSESEAQYDARDLVKKPVKNRVEESGGQIGRLTVLLERALQALDQGRLGRTGLVDGMLNLMSHPRVSKYRAVQEILSFVKGAVRSPAGGVETGAIEGGNEEQRLADMLEEALEEPRVVGIADPSNKFYYDELLRGRPLLRVSFCPASETRILPNPNLNPNPSPNPVPPLLLCCYGPSKEASIAPRLGCLCLWETSIASRPQKVLVCEGTPTSCCWAPAKTPRSAISGRGFEMVIVGTDSGSISLWDLSEPASQHQFAVTPGQGEVLVLRRPAYMTDWRPKVNHSAPACEVKVQLPVSSGAEMNGLESGISAGSESALSKGGESRGETEPETRLEGRSGHGFENGLESGSRPAAQVLSLDTSGWLHVWSVVPVTELDSAVRETDFGLRLGSKLRLLRVAAVDCFARSPGRELGFESVKQTAAGFVVVPGDPSQVLVATRGGDVIRVSRFGLPPASLPRPHSFARGTADVSGKARHVSNQRSPTSVLTSGFVIEVTCLEIREDAVLVGYSDGVIALYRLQSKLPVRQWTAVVRGRVWGLRWYPGRPAAFFALDEQSVLYLFDSQRESSEPVRITKLSKEGGVSVAKRSASEDGASDQFDVSLVGEDVMVTYGEGAHANVLKVETF